MKNKQLPLLVLGLMVLGAIGGTAYQVSARSSDNKNISQVAQRETKSDVEDVVSTDLLAQIKINETQARQVALTANPNTSIQEIQVGDENGKVIYEIELSNNTEVKIDAVDGSILKADIEDDEDEDSNKGDIDTDDIQDEQDEDDSD